MKAICSACQEDFELTQEMILEEYLGAMITETYYICPVCSAKHFVCLQNVKTRTIKKELDKLNPAAIEKRQELLKKLRMEMDILNGKVKQS